MYKLANKNFQLEEKISFVYDRTLQGYEWAFAIYQKLQSYQFCLSFSFLSDRALLVTASAKNTVTKAKELAYCGYSTLDQDKDGYVSLEDLKKCSSTAYTFIVNFSTNDLKEYKLQFYQQAIKHLKNELKAEELKDLKKEWFIKPNEFFKKVVTSVYINKFDSLTHFYILWSKLSLDVISWCQL